MNSNAGARPGRAELEAMAEAYLDALAAKDPSRLPWADQVIFTENNVQLMIGDGLWNTISARRPYYDLKAADPETGQVSWFGIVEERGHPAIMALRLAIRDGRIAEAETIVCREFEFGPFPQIEGYDAPRPLMLADVPEAERPENRTAPTRFLLRERAFFPARLRSARRGSARQECPDLFRRRRRA